MSPSLFFFILVSVFYPNTCFSKFLPNFTAVLIFGDSTVDTGNNNYIKTIIKGNHPPYGRDFPGKIATGRFSDGKLIPDFVASILGIKDTVPPFLDPKLSDDDLRTGVSFASAGSGYDHLTTHLTGAIPVSKQPGYLRSYVKRLEGIVGKEEAKNIVNGALVVVSAGSNDFIFNYYDLRQRRLRFDIDGYQVFVLNKLQKLVKELYEIGCRTMVVAGLPPLGCLPIQMTLKLRLPRTCIHSQNADSQSYNVKITSLLPQLESSLPESKIYYADIYTPLSDMMNNPEDYGFKQTRKGCCGTGLVEAGPLCSKRSPVCSNASEFLFWDGIHPTESGYQQLSQALEQQLLRQL